MRKFPIIMRNLEKCPECLQRFHVEWQGKSSQKGKIIFNCKYTGNFFNSEHSPYLFPMFNFKKHRSMHCELLCNKLYRTPEILK
jgi:hypothetical protein